MDITRTLALVLPAAALAGLLGTAAALIWLLAPEVSPFAQMSTPPPLVPLLGAAPLHGAQLLTGLLSSAVATAALRRGTVPRARLLVTAGIVLLVFGLASGSMATLAHTGYLLALGMPWILLVMVAALIRRGGRCRWMLGVPILAAMVAGAWLGRDVLRDVLVELVPAVVGEAVPLTSTALFVGLGALWLGVALLAVQGTDAAGRFTRRLVRHRRGLTILAACGPLPYALVRLTWLTPWPLFGGDRAAADPAVQTWGLVLSLGSWLGVVLTLGLIMPWGEVFPRWFPWVGGRSVPIALAAVPGFTVAALLCFAAAPIALAGLQLGTAEAVAFVLIFPCWFWGPALALAVAAYVAHRRERAEHPRRGSQASARMRG